MDAAFTVLTFRKPAQLVEEVRREAEALGPTAVPESLPAPSEKSLVATSCLSSVVSGVPSDSMVDELIHDLGDAFRRVADCVDAEAFWQACRSLAAVRLLPESLTSRMAALVWLERNPSPLPDEEWLQTLPTRLQPDLQATIQQARQTATRKRSPITSDAVSEQLEAFRQSRAQRFA